MNGSRSSNKKHQGANVLNGFGGRLVNEVSKSPPSWLMLGEPLPFFFVHSAVSPLLLFSFNVVVPLPFFVPSPSNPQKFDWTIRKKNHYISYKFPFWGFWYSALRILKRAKKYSLMIWRFSKMDVPIFSLSNNSQVGNNINYLGRLADDSSIIYSFESVAARLLDIPSSALTHVYTPEL